jgi:hypothetical protein
MVNVYPTIRSHILEDGTSDLRSDVEEEGEEYLPFRVLRN